MCGLAAMSRLAFSLPYDFLNIFFSLAYLILGI